jgi:hypothetical protein
MDKSGVVLRRPAVEVYCAAKSARPSCCVGASLHKASFSEAVRGAKLTGHGGIGWLIPDVAKIGPRVVVVGDVVVVRQQSLENRTRLINPRIIDAAGIDEMVVCIHHALPTQLQPGTVTGKDAF